ncbi:MAG: hypothetical protein F4Y49_04605 [Dehalococcoidia bacterium]|nr:hypothetical protein [Dehalococcoidia bacterium]
MNEKFHQAMPKTGRLAKNLNIKLESLTKRLVTFNKNTVYSYVVDTVEYHGGRLYQTGSGPNFQGDLITLCSCKHLMRTYLEPEAWDGVWVAGYTSSTELGSNRLFYLMRVSQAFESHREFWLSDCIPDEAKSAKAAHLDKFGDIYQPKRTSGRPYYYWHYYDPCKNHVHCELGDWRKDIDYKDRYGRRSALLVGDVEYSFLWDRPGTESTSKIGRGQKKSTIGDLFHI